MKKIKKSLKKKIKNMEKVKEITAKINKLASDKEKYEALLLKVNADLKKQMQELQKALLTGVSVKKTATRKNTQKKQSSRKKTTVSNSNSGNLAKELAKISENIRISNENISNILNS